MLIVDSSVVVKWFVDEILHAEARHIYKYQQDILAPEFVFVEVANVVWKKVQREEIEADQAYKIIDLVFEALPGFIHSPDILSEATKLAVELAHPVYDCLYLACVNGPHDTLVTADKRFFNKVKNTRFGNRVRFLDDPDLALPLYIPLHKVEQLVSLWREINITAQSISNDPEQRDFVLGPDKTGILLESTTMARIKSLISELSIKERGDLIVLCRLGQSGIDQDLAAVIEKANKEAETISADMLLHLIFYLEDGLTALRLHNAKK